MFANDVQILKMRSWLIGRLLKELSVLGAVVSIMLIALLLTSEAQAEVPHRISFQGYVTDLSQTPISGAHVMGFKIYDSQTGGDLLWSDTDTLQLISGQFHAYLGDNTPLPAGIFTGSVLWLQTEIDGSALPTRQPLVSVAYSFRAQKADTASVALSVSDPAGNCLWQTDNTSVWRPSGNVGIATAAPAFPLDVNGNLRVGSRGQNNIAVVIDGPNRPEDPNSAQDLRFSFEAAGSAGIRGYRGSSWDTYLQFLTNDHSQGSDTPQPRMTITGDGQVGIGTTTPTGRLDVRGGPIVAGYSSGNLQISGGPIDAGLWTGGEDKLRIGDWATGTKGILINLTSGNVGIGTMEPAAKLHVVGDLCVTGAKNAIVPTSQGMTKVYSEESAEVWFSDYGSGSIANGSGHIELDPTFLQTVVIDDAHPMKVFVQQTSGAPVQVVVRKGRTGFDVVCSEPTASVTFDYRVIAKRKGYEDARLERVQSGAPEHATR